MLVHHVVYDDPPAPRSLNAAVPIELDTICLKCLAKEPQQRYLNAGDLSQEIGRFLRGEPILARPQSAWQKGWRWCRRHQTVTILTAVAALLLSGLLAAGWWSYFDERNDVILLEQALTQEHLLRQAFLQTREFDGMRQELETQARIDALVQPTSQLNRDGRFSQLCLQFQAWLDHPDRHHNPQTEIELYPPRLALEAELAQIAQNSRYKLFAWFVLDANGTQIARFPTDSACGRNYARRTYFHGGTRDYPSRAALSADHGLRVPHLKQTYLSRALFTDVTHKQVLVISTPLGRASSVHQPPEPFVGILGIMIELGNLSDS